MSNIRKNEKGVTLIILVITIIVLLILTTFTLSFSLGEDGVFTKAQRIDFLEDISEIQKVLNEAEVVARANGQSNDKIKTTLEESLEQWKNENDKYKDISFEIKLNSEGDTFVLTYVDGATDAQEEWLKTVNFPGV